MCYFFICFDYIKKNKKNQNMSFMEMIFLIPFIMLAIALYAAFDAIATISFDDDEEEEGD